MYPVIVHTNCHCLGFVFYCFFIVLGKWKKHDQVHIQGMKTRILLMERLWSSSMNLEDTKSVQAKSSNGINLCRPS